MATIIANSDGGLLAQLTQFCGKIDTYSGPFGIAPGDVTLIKAAVPYWKYVLDTNDAMQQVGTSSTDFKNFVRHGSITPVATPVVPTITPYAGTVVLNIQTLLARLIQQFVDHTGYIKAVGEDLGFEAPVVVFDPATGKPNLKAKHADSGHPVLHVTVGKFDGWKIWKDTGAGHKKLDTTTHPNYIDHSPLPAQGQIAVWKYKAIYKYKGNTVGEFSLEVPVTVYGDVS